MTSAADRGEWEGLLPALLSCWADGDQAGLVDDESRRLAESSQEHRAAFLELSLRELAAFPYDAVHPRWIARELPPDPVLQLWAISLAPPTVRAELARLRPIDRRPERGRSWLEPTGPPSWFEAWWTGHLRTVIRWPRPLPWRTADPHPLARLSRLDESALAAALPAIGARPLAAAIHALPPQELVATLYGLPDPLRERLVVLIRERAFPPEGYWNERWRATLELEPVARLDRLALVELAAIAAAGGRLADGRRLAWRLPPESGGVLHRLLDQPAALDEAVDERLARLEGDLASAASERAR